ncbi:cytochrome b561 [Orbus hercynius]|uniref:Cytochrome b561 n=1 Tax=Orbus hercynius TaxID=593135 RepID=A0A495RJQ0_9GAMM|nr:cytochrome b/b6 domain-containing protein [Orbus hercynius]RKS87589.1 cytochrome b561 [Orbus hercynius]
MNNYPTYSSKQKWIHWISAILVLIVITLPLAKDSLSHLFGGKNELFTWHKSLGIIVFCITIWRIYVVIKDGVPEVLPKHERFQRILSKAVQGIIYLLLLILPLSGYLMSGRSIHFLGLISIRNLSLSNDVHRFFHSVHIIGAYLLIALLLLHIAAAIYHHVWVKDNVLKAMLPNRWFNH